MEESKKSILSNILDKRIKRSNLIIRLSILVFLGLVLYDSYVFDLPFHYIVFLFFGNIVGRVFALSHKIEIDVANKKIILQKNRLAFVFFILLVLIRFIVGPYILNVLHFVHTSDALLLLYIGIYQGKWRSIMRQIDNSIYKILSKMLK